MGKIIAIHSYRGGTGKSNTSANLAATIATMGKRVAVIDTDIQSPGIHIIFGLGDEATQPEFALNDYLHGYCDIEQTALDVTPHLQAKLSGKLYLIPSRPNASEIARIIKGYDVGLLVDGYERLVEELQLDALLIDTHPGLNNETLMSVSISDAEAIILRPDYQDYQGTAVIVNISRKLGVPNLVLVANKVPKSIPLGELRDQLQQQYHCPVGAMLPHSDAMMALGSQQIFVLAYPDHFIASQIKQLAQTLLA
ncbi:MAG: MinD/ParA family protein [Chloroflexi bacterium]|nr:MinD/ParA family protein [Chloroflexota bacterium]